MNTEIPTRRRMGRRVKLPDSNVAIDLPPWTLVTSHGLVLLYLSAYPSSTMRSVSRALGITERRVIDVIKDLEKSNLLQVEQSRRGNHYSLNSSACFRHPILSPVRVDDFLHLWQESLERELSTVPQATAALEPAY